MKPRSDLDELTTTPGVGPPEPPPKRPLAPALRPLEFARWIWRQLTSMRTALILLFLLAVAAIPGSLIPQTRVDPSAVAAFKGQHPTVTPIFERVGMFGVYSSVWFSAIYLLLMVSLVGCFVPRIRTYLKSSRSRPPNSPRNLRRLSAYDAWESDRTRSEEVDRARGLLERQRRRVEVYEGDGETVVSAEKGYLREAGNLVFHVAVLVVLVGFGVSGLFGFKGGVAVVAGDGFSNTLTQYDKFTPGGWFDTANLQPFSFQVKNFDVHYKQSGHGKGTPLDFHADLSVTDEPGAKPHPYDLRVNHPLEMGSTGVYLVGHGYAPHVTVRDGDGDIAFSGPVIFLPRDNSFTSFGVIKAPDAQPTQLGFEGYFFPTAAMSKQGRPYSAFPGPKNPVLSLVAYRGDLGLDSGIPQSVYVLDKDNLKAVKTSQGTARPLLLTKGQTVKLGNGLGSISFDGYQQFVQLQINKQPWKVVPLAGVLAAIAGLLGSLFIRPRRTWVRVREREGRTVVEVAALDRVSGGDPAAHVTDVASTLRPESPEEKK
ncbi:MAG: cytochrome c biogenesis protein ResB [Nocardioidaceae bacterium]